MAPTNPDRSPGSSRPSRPNSGIFPWEALLWSCELLQARLQLLQNDMEAISESIKKLELKEKDNDQK